MRTVSAFMPGLGVMLWQEIVSRYPHTAVQPHWIPEERRTFRTGPSVVYNQALDIINAGGGLRCECGHPLWEHEEDGPCTDDDCYCEEYAGATE